MDCVTTILLLIGLETGHHGTFKIRFKFEAFCFRWHCWRWKQDPYHSVAVCINVHHFNFSGLFRVWVNEFWHKNSLCGSFYVLWRNYTSYNWMNVIWMLFIDRLNGNFAVRVLPNSVLLTHKNICFLKFFSSEFNQNKFLNIYH